MAFCLVGASDPAGFEFVGVAVDQLPLQFLFKLPLVVMASVLLSFIWITGKRYNIADTSGWNLIRYGALLIILACALAAAETLRGQGANTAADVLLLFGEVIVGYGGGYVLVTLGILKWIRAISRTRDSLRDQVQDKSNEVAFQIDMLDRIARRTPVAETLQLIAVEAESRLQHARCAILTISPDGEGFKVAAAPHLPGPFHTLMETVPNGSSRTLCGRARAEKKPVFVRDIGECRGETPLCMRMAEEWGIRSAFALPLLELGGEPVGVLACYVSAVFESDVQPHPLDSLIPLATLAIQQHQRDETLRASQLKWQYALEAAGHGVWDYDVPSGRLHLSRQWKAMLGYAEHEIGDGLAEWDGRLHPDDRENCYADFMSMARGDTEAFGNIRRLRCKNGSYRWFLGQGRVMEWGENGAPRRAVGTHTDITEQVAANEQLREAATVFQASTEAIMITDAAGVIKTVNPAFSAVTGYAPAEVVGQNPRILKSGRMPAEYYRRMWHHLLENGHWEAEVWNRRKDGKIYPEWQTITAVRNDQGEIIEYVAVFSDVTKRRLSEEEIRFRAHYDVLTGLPNRSLLTERLDQAIRVCQRDGGKLGLLFIDLDRFKQVNDTLGHKAGDMLLREAAHRLQSCVRESDTVARQGGDEFVVLLLGVEKATDAGQVATKIAESVARPFDLNGQEARVGASIGITLFPDDGQDASTLLRNADLAMYRAKELGRNNFQFFEYEMTRRALERAALERDFRLALQDKGDFELYFQPIIDLRDGRLSGFEALSRWHRRGEQLVMPDQFIPLAEDTGLIQDFGCWVISEACLQLSRLPWTDDRLHVAVNVSSRQLPDRLSLSWLLSTVESYGLLPENLALEITERSLLDNSEETRRWLREARRQGFLVSLDDFGTGYTALAYLKYFVIDKLKIDKAFIRDLEANPSDRAVVRAILAMAGSLGLEVVAEGIETEGQKTLLSDMGCGFVQGYQIARPMPVGQLHAWIGEYVRDEGKVPLLRSV